jgi:hypothetical protein
MITNEDSHYPDGLLEKRYKFHRNSLLVQVMKESILRIPDNLKGK